jgi:hypothetical protein
MQPDLMLSDQPLSHTRRLLPLFSWTAGGFFAVYGIIGALSHQQAKLEALSDYQRNQYQILEGIESASHRGNRLEIKRIEANLAPHVKDPTLNSALRNAAVRIASAEAVAQISSSRQLQLQGQRENHADLVDPLQRQPPQIKQTLSSLPGHLQSVK